MLELGKERAEQRRQAAEDKKNQQAKAASDKAETELSTQLFGFRQPPDVKQARLDTLNANKALKNHW
jgi:hypothetical protein